MAIELEQFKLLQNFDKQIYDLNEEQKNIPLDIKAFDSKVSKQKEMVLAAETKLKEVRLDLHKKELALQEKEAQIKKYDAQLSQVKTNKEYSALQKEIANIKADNSLLEEEILKAMDSLQNGEGKVKKEKDILQSVERERDVKKKELDILLQKNNELISDLLMKRTEISSTLDKEMLAIYERIVKAKEGIALAPVVNGSCGVCRMSLLAQSISEVMMGDRVVFCRSCNRILYLSENKDVS
jgi:predicted  nucleic acid-binding Zn-ribbon protein